MPEELFQFEDFVLNRGAYELRRGGVVVPLQRIPLELLCLLIERRGQVVTRPEIIERVWGKGVFVDSETSINTAVRKVRRALCDNPDSPRLVATVPAKGYRFVAPVRETNPARPEPSRIRLPHNPLVGREREMAKLCAGLEDASAGRGSLFLISGEPGVGKTRLADEVAVAANAKGMTLLVGHCSDHDEAVAYLPFVEILENFTDRGSNMDSLRRAVGEQGPELARLLPKLKNILPELAPPLDLPPAQARRHLFNCFCDFAARIASEQPALMILDDLHWADDSTLALLAHLTQRISDLPLMVIGTYRDGEVNVTRSLAKTLEDLLRGRLATGVRLKGLPRDEVAAMLTSLSGKSPPAAVVGEIYAETEGNPFFIEELFRYLEEENRLYDSSGQFRSELKIADLEVPHNVRLVVGRRLARLNDLTQKTLAAAAAIGRSFSFKLLEAAAATEGLLDCLDEAQRAGLIFSGASSREARFEFSHELIRQVLISGQSAARRQRLHLEVAQAMEQVYAGALDDHCADLAHHYDRGGDARQAVQYLERAGVRAEQQLAYTEAIGYRTRALELLDLLPESPERDRGELELRLSLVRMLQVTRGFSAPETVDANKRAAALAEKSGNLTQLFTWVTARQVVLRESGDLAAAGALADQALELARREGSSRSILGMAHLLQIATCYQSGDLAGVERHFAEGLEFFDDPGMRQFPMAVIAAFGTASCNACLLGRADVARERDARMMAAVDANNPYDMTSSGMQAATLRIILREFEQAEMLAARALELADKHQFQEMAAICRCTVGYALAQLGRVTEGVALIRQGIAGLLELGNRSHLAGHTAFLAAAQARAGDIGEGLETVEQALQAGPVPFTRWPLIVRGELRLIQGQVELAETDFREIIALTRSRGAKGLELTATMALARLLAKHGRRDEARSMLAELYGWFTEGFDTAELKDAKALLDEL